MFDMLSIRKARKRDWMVAGEAFFIV